MDLLLVMYGFPSFFIVALPFFFSLFFSVLLEKIVYRATANARISKQIAAICFLIISLVFFTYWSRYLYSNNFRNNFMVIRAVTMFSILVSGPLWLLGPRHGTKYTILLLVPMITFLTLLYFLHPFSFAPTGW